MTQFALPKVSLPSLDEAQEISKALAVYRRPYVGTNYTRAINILFSEGRFSEVPSESIADQGLKHFDCYFFNSTLAGTHEASNLSAFFPKTSFENDDWKLICK